MVRVRVIREFGEGYSTGYVRHPVGEVVEVEGSVAGRWLGAGHVETVVDEPEVEAVHVPVVAGPQIGKKASKKVARR